MPPMVFQWFFILLSLLSMVFDGSGPLVKRCDGFDGSLWSTLVIIYAVLSHFDFVAKFMVKNLNKDLTNTGRGVHHFMKVFHKTEVFFKGWLPLAEIFTDFLD